MIKKTLKERIKRRKRTLRWLIGVCVVAVFVLCVSYNKANTNDESNNNDSSTWEVVFEISAMVVSALGSTILAIHITKDDIMENDYAEKKDSFGVITFESGYSKVFDNDDCTTYLKAADWEQFFNNAKDKKICIVGVSLTGYFETEKYRKCLLELCLEKNYEVSIILGNPYGEEVLYQAEAENKASCDYIKKKIFMTYNLFQQDIAEFDKKYRNTSHPESASDKLKGKFKILFSDTLPKTLIFKSGKYMIVSPYMHSAPIQAPTLIIEDSRAESFYENYMTYIEKLVEHSHEFHELTGHIPAAKFFSQPYRDLSDEFIKDIQECTSLKMIGLGQKHMFTQLESKIIELLNRQGTFEAILSDPEGMSTKMCVMRSIIHNSEGEAAYEHKLAINHMMNYKQGKCVDKVHIYKWDCFFPFTMYLFNSEDEKRTKAYIWITNLLQTAEKRQGFVLSGLTDKEAVKLYLEQFNNVKTRATEITVPYNLN